jgi:hypothetical protein
MAQVTCKVAPLESLKLYYAGRIEPSARYGTPVPWAPIQTVAADANGLAVFTGVTSRIEYAAQRPDGRFIRMIDSATRVAMPRQEEAA